MLFFVLVEGDWGLVGFGEVEVVGVEFVMILGGFDLVLDGVFEVVCVLFGICFVVVVWV